MGKFLKIYHYKVLYTISNNFGVYEEPVPRAKKIPHIAVKFEASEENRIISESLYRYFWFLNATPGNFKGQLFSKGVWKLG